MNPFSTLYPPSSISTILTCSTTGQCISLTQQIANSGEGEVWQTNLNGYLAKVYHNPSPERIQKLEVMVANPPQDPNVGMNHISFAWPKFLLLNASGQGVGFLMPAITQSVELIDVYNPRRRQKVLPGFNWLYLHITALNLASIIAAIHAKGYVLGDIKPQNVLVSNRALPAIIDTDSFQVRHPQTGQIYHCPVGSEGFTPSELLGTDLAVVEQTEGHDRFRLGVLIYLLLFGDHPFKGKWIGEGESPSPTELLLRGLWPYAEQRFIQPGPLTIPLEIVHPAVQACFLRCFNAGHTTPSLRPTAKDWYAALKVAVADLKVCSRDKRHYYSQEHGTCYWCDRKKTLGVDIFSTSSSTTKNATQKTSAIARLNKEITKRVPTALKTPAAIAAQKIGTLKPGTFTRSGASSFAQPVSSTQPAPPPTTSQITTSLQAAWSQYRPMLVGLGTLVGGTGALFAVLVMLSRSAMDQGEIELTMTGIVLCLGLVVVCFLLNKVMEKNNHL